jgi:hypothetical protein
LSATDAAKFFFSPKIGKPGIEKGSEVWEVSFCNIHKTQVKSENTIAFPPCSAASVMGPDENNDSRIAI